MALGFAIDIGLATDPGDLHDAALAYEWRVSMPGVICTAKRDERTHFRAYFGDEVV